MCTIEIFSAGCGVCDETVKLVQELTCPSCHVQVVDVSADKAGETRAKQYGIRRFPAVVVDGKLAECCDGDVNQNTLRSLGIGTAT